MSPQLQQSLAGSHVQPIVLRGAKAVQFALRAESRQKLEAAFHRREAAATDIGRNLSQYGVDEAANVLDTIREKLKDAPQHLEELLVKNGNGKNR